MNELKLKPVYSLVCGVHTSDGTLVGNLKLIAGAWKFKAIGVDVNGHVIPGGGPLTGQHNKVFAVLDEAAISAALLAG